VLLGNIEERGPIGIKRKTVRLLEAGERVTLIAHRSAIPINFEEGHGPVPCPADPEVAELVEAHDPGAREIFRKNRN
jgi:hypothetical protein